MADVDVILDGDQIEQYGLFNGIDRLLHLGIPVS